MDGPNPRHHAGATRLIEELQLPDWYYDNRYIIGLLEGDLLQL